MGKKNRYLPDSLSIQGTATEIEVPQEIIDYYKGKGMSEEFVKRYYCTGMSLDEFRTHILNCLLEETKDHKMTAEEKRAQAISFAYGNCKLSNENITREQVERAYDQLHADDDFVGKD